jgi:Secretion system C-terminal sorting domain
VNTDFGALTNWSITINYNAPGTGPVPTLSYLWTPFAGLYTLPSGSGAYTGQNLTTVYAAPTVQTTYTVTATNVATGCTNTATALVNYTPPAPTITPSSVTMCLGDPSVCLASSSSTTSNLPQICSGPISVIVPDFSVVGATSNLTVSGVPAGCNISNMSVTFNMNHTWAGDVAVVLKAPNGNILNLDYYLSTTGGTGATTGFVNTKISSTGTAALSSVGSPYTGTFKADAATAVAPGFGPTGPAGVLANVNTWAALYSVPNGTWTLGMVDPFNGDQGTLTSWCMDITYVCGVPASATIWSPIGGLYNNAAATIPYTGDRRDTVYTRPTPAGVYTYTATVNNLISITATPTTPMAGGNGNFLVTFNVKNNNAVPVTLSSISSNTFGSGAVTSTVFYKPGGNAGNPGPISAANGFIQFGSAASTVTAGALNLLVSGTTLQIPAGATYAIALDMTGATFPAYTNGTGTVVTYSNGGCDILVDGNVGWGGPNAPGTPVNNPRNFNGSITFLATGPGTCTSPGRTVIVTVNQPTVVTAHPVNQTICTDKVATFTVAAGGTGPFSYQWKVSTNNGNPPWGIVNNGGVYSGANTATLTITAPPVTMSGYQYHCVITGAAPCASDSSRNAILTVNPLPVVTVAPVYSALMPGLTTTLTSTVSPNAAATYSWIRDGVVLTGSSPGVLSGIGTGTLKVDVDGMGLYTLRVTDVNGCTNTSNSALVKDSASGKCFIYPNPTSGTFQVRYYSVANNVLPRGIVVYDAKGDRVFLQNYTVGRPYDRMDVDMRAYGKGLYWVEIVDLNGNRLTMCRVVIQ